MQIYQSNIIYNYRLIELNDLLKNDINTIKQELSTVTSNDNLQVEIIFMIFEIFKKQLINSNIKDKNININLFYYSSNIV